MTEFSFLGEPTINIPVQFKSISLLNKTKSNSSKYPEVLIVDIHTLAYRGSLTRDHLPPTVNTSKQGSILSMTLSITSPAVLSTSLLLRSRQQRALKLADLNPNRH